MLSDLCMKTIPATYNLIQEKVKVFRLRFSFQRPSSVLAIEENVSLLLWINRINWGFLEFLFSKTKAQEWGSYPSSRVASPCLPLRPHSGRGSSRDAGARGGGGGNVWDTPPPTPRNLESRSQANENALKGRKNEITNAGS